MTTPREPKPRDAIARGDVAPDPVDAPPVRVVSQHAALMEAAGRCALACRELADAVVALLAAQSDAAPLPPPSPEPPAGLAVADDGILTLAEPASPYGPVFGARRRAAAAAATDSADSSTATAHPPGGVAAAAPPRTAGTAGQAESHPDPTT